MAQTMEAHRTTHRMSTGLDIDLTHLHLAARSLAGILLGMEARVEQPTLNSPGQVIAANRWFYTIDSHGFICYRVKPEAHGGACKHTHHRQRGGRAR